MAKKSVLARLDAVVSDFCNRTRYFQEDMTKGRARMFAMQHRLNTRQRNSVLKLKVATNCPDWDTRINIIKACSQEVIADHEHGGTERRGTHGRFNGVGSSMRGLSIRRAGPSQAATSSCSVVSPACGAPRSEARRMLKYSGRKPAAASSAMPAVSMAMMEVFCASIFSRAARMVWWIRGASARSASLR